jgi:hypothetical protein
MAFTIYEDQFYSGMFEVVAQNTNVFNEASRNTINIIPREHIGDFSKEAFFTEEASVINRRDITVNTDGAASDLDSDELVGVKLYRRYQWDKRLTDIKRIGFTEQEYSRIVGEKTGEQKMKDMLNTGLLCLSTALEAAGSNEDDITSESPNTLNYDAIPGALQLFGDNSPALRQVVGHSKPIHDLLGDALSINVENVAGTSINQGSIPSLGKGLSMTDSSDLVVTDGVSSGTDAYKTLFLAENALRIEESEDETMVSDVVDGKENIVVRVQGEYAITCKVKGIEYSDSGANPNDSALGNTSNWNQVASDTKNTAGIYIKSA